MISHQITDIRHFMHHLLSGNTFDRFLLREALIQMNVSWHIEGRIHPSFYDSDDLPPEEYIAWEEVRKEVYEILRGNRLPLSMKIILALPRPSIRQLMIRSGREEDADRVRGMFLNILYQPSGLVVTSGISRTDFSADKRPDQVFDDSIRHFLRKHALN